MGCYSVDQARSAYEQAVNGYTKEEREIAAANVKKAIADIAAVQSIIDQMVVYAPVASQVYQRNVEPGEYVSPGVPLVTLIDLNDLWIHFDLSENLVRTLKLGDRFDVLIPALSDRRITVEAKLIATKGEYASWRATRANRRFRPAHILDARLSHRKGAGASPGDERLSRLAHPLMRPRPRPD